MAPRKPEPLPVILTLVGLLIIIQGSYSERISAKKCREYKEFYRETFAPRITGRTPIVGKAKCPRFPRVHNPNLKRGAFQHEFPHTASLWYQADVNSTTSGYKFRCSGTLISKRHVLVPGHCIYSKWGKPTHVMFGDSNLYKETRDSRRQVAEVTDIIFHPNYVPPSFIDDLAILVLKKGVKYDVKSKNPRPSVRPACLPVENQPINFGVALTTYNVKEGSLVTERVQLFKTNHDCEPILKEQQGANFTVRLGEKMRITQFCSEGLPSGTCLSDIGGALTIQPDRSMTCIDTIVGMIAINSPTCKPGEAHPIVYTKIEQYLDWIEGVVWPTLFKRSGLLRTSKPGDGNITEVTESDSSVFDE